ncbi:MAG: RbsD/FucU family protein [Armatimonadetes bacterium]|nr:RbsD/FucU family protein [Armatimonadota bacterium]
MLKTPILHPEILAALGAAGHGSQILIADGNYPFITKSPPTATIVYLNLAPDMVGVIDVLRPLLQTVPVEGYAVMDTPPDMEKPAIFKEFEALLVNIPETRFDRFAFYDAASDPATALVIATGERRVYANILLTIGVIPP